MPLRSLLLLASTLALLPCRAQEAEGTAVTLLEPGAEPRRDLRYRFKAGVVEALDLELRLAASTEMGELKSPERALPPILLTVALEAKSVSPEGELQFDFKVDDFKLVEGGEGNPARLASLRQMLEGLREVSGSGSVSSRGLHREGEFRAPAAANPLLLQVTDQLRQCLLHEVPVPLPREAVGAGARWKATTPVRLQELKATRVVTYTLREAGAEKPRCEVAIDETASPQKMVQPGLPAGYSPALDSLSSTGSGSAAIDLAALVPTSSLRKLHRALEVSLEAQGQTHKMKVNQRVETALLSRASGKGAPPAEK
jgi:hypothetical protein